jgi:hypothetical protein
MAERFSVCMKHLENKGCKMDSIVFQKMLLIYNSIENGWTVKKINNQYVFTKPNTLQLFEEEVLENDYLENFIKQHFTILDSAFKDEIVDI